MSFPIGSGILTPTEFDVVRRIFSEISSEQWFTTSGDRREQFALLVIDAYRNGLVEPEVLSRHCRAVAFMDFGNDGLTH